MTIASCVRPKANSAVCLNKKTEPSIKDLGLSAFEYNEIVKRLGRKPSELELYLFSAMWSEHCGYKHSKKYLKLLVCEEMQLQSLSDKLAAEFAH